MSMAMCNVKEAMKLAGRSYAFLGVPIAAVIGTVTGSAVEKILVKYPAAPVLHAGH
jgi:hypothetical protein